MMNLTNSNYFTSEASQSYWSVSQFKSFCKCEACALAEISGEYQREPSTALLVGSYVDTFFTGDKGALGRFVLEHPEITNSRTGALKSEFKHAETMIEAVKAQPLMMGYLRGKYQQIFTGTLFDVPWKIKVDVMNSFGIVDLKTVRDFSDIYETGFGYRSWIEYWGYDIQGAVYQAIVEQATGERRPFYLVAVTKEKVPDVAVIQIPQHILDTALKIVESKIDRFDLVKKGLVPPNRCEVCEYCRSTKILTEPMVYEIEEA